MGRGEQVFAPTGDLLAAVALFYLYSVWNFRCKERPLLVQLSSMEKCYNWLPTDSKKRTTVCYLVFILGFHSF